MKKIPVLILVLAAAAVPVMAASTVTFSGELTYGFITNGTNVADAYGNAVINLAAKVDDNNSIATQLATAYQNAGKTVLTDLAGGTATLNVFSVYLGNFSLTSDLGAILGIKSMFDPVLQVGWFDPTTGGYTVSGYGNENANVDPGNRDAFQLSAGIGSVATVKFAFSPQIINSSGAQLFSPNYLLDVSGGMGPVSLDAALYYDTNDVSTASKGDQVAASAKFSQAFGDISLGVAASVNYNFEPAGNPAAPASDAARLSYGAGLSVGYTSMVTVGASLRGSGAGLKDLQANVSLVPIANAGLDLGLAMDNALANFAGVDTSVWYKFGPTTIRVGYLYENAGDTDANWKTPAGLAPNGGAYVSADLSF